MSRVIIQNPDRAERVIAFLEKLPIIDGPTVGKPMLLDPWQKAWISDIYSPSYEDGKRVVRAAALSVARKNSKSFLTSGLLLCHLIGPECETNGQVYSCANDREQAAVIFRMCKQMIELRPSLQKYLKVVDSTKTIYVTRSDVKARGSFFRALSAESTTKHGLGPSFFAFDELGEARDRVLLDTMIDGQQARLEPLYIVISTQNNDPQHPLSQLIDDGLKGEDPSIVVHLHAADEGCDVMDRAQWLKANPALASWKTYDAIEIAAARAKRLPSEEHNFRRRYLNQRTALHASLISRADWKACEGEGIRPGEPIYLGLDLSTRTDLTALVAVSAEDGSRVSGWAWKPTECVEEHAKRDRFDYHLQIAKGALLTAPGRSVDPMVCALKIADLVKAGHEVRGLAYDRWRIDEFLRCLDQIGLTVPVVPWGQGFKDMAPAVDAFECAVVDGELSHDNNAILTWCVMNAQAVSDPTGARKLDKSKSRFRIDSAVALVQALGMKMRDRQQVVASPWDDPDFSIEVI